MYKSYEEVKGDLIKLAQEGKFDVIAHGCNCFSTMRSGIAPQMAKAFGCDKFNSEENVNAVHKLGNIDFEGINSFGLGTSRITNRVASTDYNLALNVLYVVNAYTQYGFKKNRPDEVLLDYAALELCFWRMNKIFAGMHIGLPQIGCGLAGGNWLIVKRLILNCFTNCTVTVVIFESR